MEIRVQYQGTPTKSTLEKPKKKVPPSKIRRNRQRLAKFLQKEGPNLPPATSHEIPEGLEGAPTPPLITPLSGTCVENMHVSTVLQSESVFHIPASQPSPLQHIFCNAFTTDEIQGINKEGTDLQTNLENNTNWSKKEKEKTEGMIEFAGDTEAGREDKTEDKDETKDKWEDEPEDKLEDTEVRLKTGLFSSPVPGETEEQHIQQIHCLIPRMSIDTIRRLHIQGARKKCSLEKESSSEEESNSEGEINPTQENIARPCTNSITENVVEDAIPVQKVQVPAHQVSDRKFVTVERKRRKRKDNQTDCKAS